jgi:hypothetical protein
MIGWHIHKYKTRYLFYLPLLNFLALWWLITIHWLTGKYGYLFSVIHLIFGIFLIYVFFIVVKSLKFNLSSLWRLAGLILLAVAFYCDVNYVWLTIQNNGWFPCTNASFP